MRYTLLFCRCSIRNCEIDKMAKEGHKVTIYCNLSENEVPLAGQNHHGHPTQRLTLYFLINYEAESNILALERDKERVVVNKV